MVNEMATQPQPNEQVPVEVPVEEKKVKKSFVSDKDAPLPTSGAPKEQKIVPCEVSLMLIYNQSKVQTDLLTEIRDILKSGVSQTKSVPVATPTPTPAPVATQTPAPVQGPPTTTQTPTQAMSPRLQEIMKALEPVNDLVYIDEEASANDTMFYIIRPRQFLGSENFSKVGSIMRSIGAQYQSAGKSSHFKASKAGK